MKNLYIIFSLIAFLSLQSCNRQKVASDYMMLDEVVYIDRFPHTFDLKNGEPVDLDIIGFLDMSIHDSLLIISTTDGMGYWSFFSLPDMEYKGKYLIQGRGPDEFLSVPWVSQQYFYTDDKERLFAIIYDFKTGNSYKMDIYETLENSRLTMFNTNYKLPRTLFSFIVLDSTTFLCKEINSDHTQDTRYILNNGIRKTSGNIEKLNLASIKQGEDHNILNAHTRSPNGKRIVEANLYLNQINLYSIDDSFGKTICFGKKLDNIRDIANTKRPDRMHQYMNVVAYPDFFGALYFNDTEAEYELRTYKKPVIQFFDWDGNPIAKVTQDRYITSFEIDFINECLYTMDHRTEEIYKYDLRDVLHAIKQQIK